MIPVIEEQDGINGKWQINTAFPIPKMMKGKWKKVSTEELGRPCDPVKELVFDPKAVHETLKRDRKRRTVKVQQPELL
jgi:hypothetical protein